MTKRARIEAKIEKVENEIKERKKLIQQLRRESYLLSDKEQWYTEEMRTVTISKRPKVTKEVLFGYINWIDGFLDEYTGKVIKIERCQVVKKDGHWIV